MTNPSIEEELEAILAKTNDGECSHGAVYVRKMELKQYILTLIARTNTQARIDEIVEFSRATAELHPKETWEEWAYRVTDYFNDRIKTLSQEQSKEVNNVKNT